MKTKIKMGDEILEYFKRKSRITKLSFWEKRRYKKMLKSLSQIDLNNMRDYLIQVGLPIIKINWNGKNVLDNLIIDLFPERIKTLEREKLYGLYKCLKELEESKGKEYYKIILSEFILKVSFSYSSSGWLLKKNLSQKKR